MTRVRLRWPVGRLVLVVVALGVAALSGAGYGLRLTPARSDGVAPPARTVRASDVTVPPGYRIEPVATGLSFPTGLAFDGEGRACLVETGIDDGQGGTGPRLVRLEPDGRRRTLATGGSSGHWNGVAFHEGSFYVAESGRILRVDGDGSVAAVVDGPPRLGELETNGPAVGPDGWVYFGQGAADPVVDPDASGGDVAGREPASGTVMRVRPGGGPPERVAWGFRDPSGLAFSPTGQLFVTDDGYEESGSGPAWRTGGFLWKVTAGRRYGWPGPGPAPAAIFGVRSSTGGIDFSRSEAFGHVGDAFVAQFGDRSAEARSGGRPPGFKVVRVEPATGVVQEFAVNSGADGGPASLLRSGGLERPVAVRFGPDGRALYIVDFGVLGPAEGGLLPQKDTGVLWRVTREW